MILILTYVFLDGGRFVNFTSLKRKFNGFGYLDLGFSTDAGWFFRTSDGLKMDLDFFLK
jgi:hypothetical protein